LVRGHRCAQDPVDAGVRDDQSSGLHGSIDLMGAPAVIAELASSDERVLGGAEAVEGSISFVHGGESSTGV